MANENNDETALVPLTREEVAALVPDSPDALLAPVGAGSAAPESKGGQGFPYIGFRGAKAKTNLEALDAADIKVGRDGSGQFYLMVPPTPIKTDPCQIHLLQFNRIYTTVDDAGNVMEAIFESDDDAFQYGFREAIYAVVAAVMPNRGGYVPATLQLRGAQCNALRDAIRLLGDKDHPGPAMDAKSLAARGPAWAAASAIKTPGLRFRTTIWSTAETPKGGGQKFNQGHGQVRPTPADEVESIQKWVVEGWPIIKQVVGVNNARFEKVRRLALAQAQESSAGS
jgi:hypothetical protein